MGMASVNQERGPVHNPSEVDAFFAKARKSFPGAQVVASTWDTFLEAAEQYRDSFPVIEGEVGDSWIYGVPSDPYGHAVGRELERARQEWLWAGRASMDDPGFRSFSLQLQIAGEHTHGVFQGYVNDTVLPSKTTYRKAPFTKARQADASPVRYVEASWAERRQFLANATAALPEALKVEAEQRMGALRPRNPPQPALDPSFKGPFSPSDVDKMIYNIKDTTIGFNATSGAIAHLACPSGASLADSEHQLGVVRYQSFTLDDYNAWAAKYMRKGKCLTNFCKTGMENSGTKSGLWSPKLKDLWRKNDNIFLLHLSWFADEPVRSYGAPIEFWVTVNVSSICPGLSVSMEVEWRNKSAVRIPEDMWVSFSPKVGGDAEDWRMGKMDSWISPFSVVPGGMVPLHVISDSGVKHPNGGADIVMKSLDAGLAAPGGKVPNGLLAFGDEKPKLEPTTIGGGWHFNLHNNLWNTNYPLWYPFVPDDDAGQKFRFRISRHAPVTEVALV